MPYDEVTNETRAGWAGEALGTFASLTRLQPTETDLDEALVDLLCDLCHLAKARGLDPVEAVRKGLAGFMEEDLGDRGPRVEITVDPAAPSPAP
jgi:hypothetical protein